MKLILKCFYSSRKMKEVKSACYFISCGKVANLLRQNQYELLNQYLWPNGDLHLHN